MNVKSLDKYRKNGSTQYRVTVTNKAMPRNIIDMDVKDRLEDVEDGELKSMYF